MGIGNIGNMMKVMNAWNTFKQNHPKFPAFIQAAGNGMMNDGTIVDITITAPDGRRISTNVKLCEEDLELFRQLK